MTNAATVVLTLTVVFATCACLAQANLECWDTYVGGRIIKGGSLKTCDKAQSGCAKKVYDNSTVTRGCDLSCQELYAVKPYEIYISKDKATLYCCYGDKCNGASTFVLAPFLLFVTMTMCV